MRGQEQHRSLRREKRSARGITIIIVMFMAIVFLILIGTMLDVLTMEAQATGATADSYSALTSAYSGVDAQILSIEEFYVSGTAQGLPQDVGKVTIPSQSDPQHETGYDTHITGTFSAYGSGLKYFLITSIGFVQDTGGGPTQVRLQRQVTALVRQVPFSKYSQFTETEKSNTGNTVWYSNPQSYQGLVYSGGPMHVMYTPGSNPPIFQQGFQTADPVFWFNTATGQQGGKAGPTGASLSSVYGPGVTGTVVSPQDLPGLTQNLVVFSEAFNGDNDHNDLTDFDKETAGLAPGVYLNGQEPSGGSTSLDTGIFVQGDADVTASASGNTETFTFQPVVGDKGVSIPTTTTVVIDFGADTTTVNEGGLPQTIYNGVPSGEAGGSSGGNGGIFDNGSLTIEDGSVIHGQYTVALPDPPTSGQEMTVKGSVTYQTEPDPQNGVLSNDELALWANDVFLNDTANSNPRIDGMLLTGFVNECQSGACRDGSFYNVNCGTLHCTGATGNITLFGSIIENIRGELGLLGPNQTMEGGFLRTAIYDSRLGSDPPPFSPTTNQYFIVALEDNGCVAC